MASHPRPAKPAPPGAKPNGQPSAKPSATAPAAASARPLAVAAAQRAPRASLGRADLLRLLALWGDGAEHAAAALTGYHWQPPRPAEPLPDRAAPPSPAATPPQTPTAQRPRPQARHYSVRFTEAPGAQTAPDYAARLRADALPPGGPPPWPVALLPGQRQPAPPPWQPLAPDRRLAVFAEKHLRQPRPVNQWDVAALLRQTAQGLPPAPRKARLRRPRWTGQPLVIHMAPQTEPLHEDYRQLARVVHQRGGGRAPVYLRVPGEPWQVYDPVRAPDALPRLWRPLAQPPRLAGAGGVAVGATAGQRPARTAWPRGWAPAMWLAAWQPQGEAPPGAAPDAMPDAKVAAPLDALLALLSLAIIVSPPLLRALRRLASAPVAAEVLAWNHADVGGNGVAIAILPARRSHHVARLQTLPPDLRQQAAACIAAHHVLLSREIALEEAQLAHIHAPGAPVPRPEAHFHYLAWQLHHQPGGENVADLMAYLQRAGHRADPALWQQAGDFRLAWAVANQQALATGRGLPVHFPVEHLEALRQAVGGQGAAQPLRQLLRLRQQDEALWLELAEPGPSHGPAASPSHWLGQWLCGPVVQWRAGAVEPWQRLPSGATGASLPVRGAVILTDGLTVCEVHVESRPPWALEWARDRLGLYALAPNPWGEPVRVEWPDIPPTSQSLPLYFENLAPGKADALLLQRDDYGLLASLVVNQVADQSFRYLPPGRFLMGSLDDEPDSESDEGPQHWVTLTEGLWLADTACTQGLWQAVMGGGNPSQFKGDVDLPVEQISWDDVQQFLARLQAFLPEGVEAVLPTEAQWEYACRAGTITPFSFGDQITTQQVNYDGNYPYDGGAKGEARSATVRVKALSANAWGLHHMHGNVWEWCADAMRDYSEQPVSDPSGAMGEESNLRAVRGGSWFDDARYARSAQRDRDPRGRSSSNVGFRFALRSRSPQGASGPMFGPEALAADAARRGGMPRPKKIAPSPKKKK